jgi:transposase InsO family protein
LCQSIVINRKFKYEKPNLAWLSDITEHPTAEGKVYWCGYKDLCSNKIVGQAASARMTTDLVLAALKDALSNRHYPTKVIIHSDRGSQYTSNDFKKTIKSYDLVQSMGQVRTCADNAAIESFNALLQKNVLNRKKHWQTRSELISRIYSWVNNRYNGQRRQDGLNRMTPIEYEAVYFDIV